MAFPLSLSIDQDEHHYPLRVVGNLVRAGLAEDGDVGQLHTELESALAELKAQDEASPEMFDQVDKLELATFDAEFHAQKGQYDAAVEVLLPFWKDLESRLRVWADRRGQKKHPRFQQTRDPRLLRQQILVMVHFCFYENYIQRHRYQRAIDYFQQIDQLIREELYEHPPKNLPEGESDLPDETEGYVPYGTIALLHYFTGHCYRAQRNFVEADHHFLEAQIASEARVERVQKDAVRAQQECNTQLEDPGLPQEQHDKLHRFLGLLREEHRAALAYNTVFTARVLGAGSAWCALQRGRLVRAEHLMRAALALLSNTRQESHKLFIRALLYIAMRRRHPFASTEYAAAMRGLSECAAKFTEGNETDRLRCLSEMVRGELDLANFTDRDQNDHLRKAERYLAELEPRARGKSSNRYHLHAARLWRLRKDLEKAREHLTKVDPFAGRSDVQRHAQADYAIERALQALDERAPDKRNKALDHARSITRDALEELGQLDPVLKADCLVLQAQVDDAATDVTAVHKSLAEWRKLSPFVDNYYLHHLARELEATNPHDSFTCAADEIPTTHAGLQELRQRFNEWIRYVIMDKMRSKPAGDVAKVLDRDRHTIERWRKGEGRPPKAPV